MTSYTHVQYNIFSSHIPACLLAGVGVQGQAFYGPLRAERVRDLAQGPNSSCVVKTFNKTHSSIHMLYSTLCRTKSPGQLMMSFIYKVIKNHTEYLNNKLS